MFSQWVFVSICVLATCDKDMELPTQSVSTETPISLRKLLTTPTGQKQVSFPSSDLNAKTLTSNVASDIIPQATMEITSTTQSKSITADSNDRRAIVENHNKVDGYQNNNNTTPSFQIHEKGITDIATEANKQHQSTTVDAAYESNSFEDHSNLTRGYEEDVNFTKSEETSVFGSSSEDNSYIKNGLEDNITDSRDIETTVTTYHRFGQEVKSATPDLSISTSANNSSNDTANLTVNVLDRDAVTILDIDAVFKNASNRTPLDEDPAYMSNTSDSEPGNTSQPKGNGTLDNESTQLEEELFDEYSLNTFNETNPAEGAENITETENDFLYTFIRDRNNSREIENKDITLEVQGIVNETDNERSKIADISSDSNDTLQYFYSDSMDMKDDVESTEFFHLTNNESQYEHQYDTVASDDTETDYEQHLDLNISGVEDANDKQSILVTEGPADATEAIQTNEVIDVIDEVLPQNDEYFLTSNVSESEHTSSTVESSGYKNDDTEFTSSGSGFYNSEMDDCDFPISKPRKKTGESTDDLHDPDLESSGYGFSGSETDDTEYASGHDAQYHDDEDISSGLHRDDEFDGSGMYNTEHASGNTNTVQGDAPDYDAEGSSSEIDYSASGSDQMSSGSGYFASGSYDDHIRIRTTKPNSKSGYANKHRKAFVQHNSNGKEETSKDSFYFLAISGKRGSDDKMIVLNNKESLHSTDTQNEGAVELMDMSSSLYNEELGSALSDASEVEASDSTTILKRLKRFIKDHTGFGEG